MRKLEPFFFWLRWFYPKAKGIPWFILLYFFFPQKILRINGRVPWPTHFTSRILYHRNIRIKNNAPLGMSSCCYIQARNGIIAGNNVLLGPGVGLVSANHDMEDYGRWVDAPPIRIGDNVWIGMNTVVLPGVQIGSNVVIASNSCVNCDIPPNSIAAGTPCRVIREKSQYRGTDYGKIDV